MKKRLITALTGALAAASLSLAAVPAAQVDAATLLDGSTVTSAPAAGLVGAGTTAQMLVFQVGDQAFNLIIDKNTNFGPVKYLHVGEAVQIDFYFDASGQLRVADFTAESHPQQYKGDVALSRDAAAPAAAPAAQNTNTNTNTNTNNNTNNNGANVAVVQTNTVKGSVDANSTNDTLYLSTRDGRMIFKFDANTDMTNGKVVIPGYDYNITYYNGGDGYNHIARVVDLSGNNVGTGYGVSTTTVYKDIAGTVAKGTVQNTLYLQQNGSNASTIIKIDATTDTSGCHVLKQGQKVTVTFAPGPDGYQHALSIKDGTPKETQEGGMGDKGMLTNQVTTYVYGTFSNSSTDDVAILSVNGQDMKLRLDSGSKGTNVPAIDPGWSYSAQVYYGGDSYWHIATFTEEAGNRPDKNVTVNANSQATFTGTIQSDTKANKLYLKTADGSVVQIKLDTTTDASKCRILRDGRKITAVCGHGSDGYWHALTLTRTN